MLLDIYSLLLVSWIMAYDIANPDDCGKGSNTVSGFSSFKFYEVFDGQSNF